MPHFISAVSHQQHKRLIIFWIYWLLQPSLKEDENIFKATKPKMQMNVHKKKSLLDYKIPILWAWVFIIAWRFAVWLTAAWYLILNTVSGSGLNAEFKDLLRMKSPVYCISDLWFTWHHLFISEIATRHCSSFSKTTPVSKTCSGWNFTTYIWPHHFLLTI